MDSKIKRFHLITLIGSQHGIKFYIKIANALMRLQKPNGKLQNKLRQGLKTFARVVDLGLILSRVKLTTLNLVFTASLLDAQHLRYSVANKPASLLVALGTALTGIPPSW